MATEAPHKQNIIMTKEVWASIVRVAGELTAERGERVALYRALDLIINLGLAAYHDRTAQVNKVHSPIHN